MPKQKTSLSFYTVFSPSFFLSSQEPCPPKWLMVYSVLCHPLLPIPISLSWTLIIFNISIVITLWSFLISSSFSLNSHQNASQTLNFPLKKISKSSITCATDHTPWHQHFIFIKTGFSWISLSPFLVSQYLFTQYVVTCTTNYIHTGIHAFIFYSFHSINIYCKATYMPSIFQCLKYISNYSGGRFLPSWTW